MILKKETGGVDAQRVFRGKGREASSKKKKRMSRKDRKDKKIEKKRETLNLPASRYEHERQSWVVGGPNV